MPQVLWMENVDAIANKKNMPNFQKWLDFLDSIGYKSYYQKLNSKDYGIPQNRSRMFVCSLLDEHPYVFPEPILLQKRLKDVLESNVDESYYINSEKAQKLIVELIESDKLPSHTHTHTLSNTELISPQEEQIYEKSPTRSRRHNEGSSTSSRQRTELLNVEKIGFIEKGTGEHQSNQVFGQYGIAPTIPAVSYKAPIKVIDE